MQPQEILGPRPLLTAMENGLLVMLKCDKVFLIFVYSEKRQNISRRKKKLQPLKFSGFIADLGM